MQKFADEVLQQLPTIIRELRRNSDSFKMEEIEEALTKLYISPFQSPTLEQRPTTVNFESPSVSRIEPSNDQLLNRNVNTLQIAEASLPNSLHNLTNKYALPPSAMTNQASGPPRITPHVNFSCLLYTSRCV